MGKKIRKAHAIPSKYLNKNGKIETFYTCSVCNMGLSKEQKHCSKCYRIIFWE